MALNLQEIYLVLSILQLKVVATLREVRQECGLSFRPRQSVNQSDFPDKESAASGPL